MKHTLFLLLLVFGEAEARTLGNQSIEQVFDRSTAVAHVQILEARVLVVSDSLEESEPTPTCGTNVRARVIESYKGSVGAEVEFTVSGTVVVGARFLGFFQEIDTRAWYQDEWLSLFRNYEVTDAELSCLAGVYRLKTPSFPQRLIPIGDDGFLDVEVNNIVFPVETIKEVDEPISTIAQYTKKRIDFRKLRPFLLDQQNRTVVK